MSGTEFRAALADLGFTQSSFVRKLIELGDHRKFETILRSVANYARGVSCVPGEMCVVLNLLKSSESR